MAEPMFEEANERSRIGVSSRTIQSLRFVSGGPQAFLAVKMQFGLKNEKSMISC